MKVLSIIAVVLVSGCDSIPGNEPERPIGRYVIAQSNDQLGRAILLDTATGQTWYQQSTGPSAIGDVSEWLPMDKTTVERWSRLTHPQPSSPQKAN